MDSDASAVQARPRERTPNTSAGTPGSVPAEWSPWIGGRETRTDVEYDPVINPATGAVLCRVARCGTAEIDFAARAADAALAGWAGMPTAERGRMLMRVARHVRECETELALLETLNNGKPLREARDDVVKSAEAFEFYAGLSDKLFGSTIPISPQYLSYTLREPLGVTAHIAPWNYPLRLAVRSVAPALAAGNTVV